jgi:glycosyltransferase involved in cell wall biosynthesis
LAPVVEALGEDAGEVYTRTAPRSVRPIVVASGNDLATASRTRRTIALFEHGASQAYTGVRNRSYAGGPGRAKASLFVCPNQRCADLNTATNPNIPCVVVGSPRVDVLRRIERTPGPTTVAIAFHWRCRVCPEAGTALDHYKQSLAGLRVRLGVDGIELVGHGHPRAATELRRVYEAAGIEWVPSFEDVVARASVFVADNSSTIFEAAACDIPVVLLNCPQYRRDVGHGLRFWDEADVGVQVDGPGGLVDGIRAALTDPGEQHARRRRTTERVYPFAGEGVVRAADALRALL